MARIYICLWIMRVIFYGRWRTAITDRSHLAAVVCRYGPALQVSGQACPPHSVAAHPAHSIPVTSRRLVSRSPPSRRPRVCLSVTRPRPCEGHSSEDCARSTGAPAGVRTLPCRQQSRHLLHAGVAQPPVSTPALRVGSASGSSGGSARGSSACGRSCCSAGGSSD